MKTTIEQSKKLLELGLDPSTADTKTFYKRDVIEEENRVIIETIPAWTTDKLLDLLPCRIREQGIDIRKGPEYYQIAYGTYTQSGSWSDMISTKQCKAILEAAYDIMCWLLENKYI